MAFSNDEILTLAKAGFNAQQIAALNMVGSQPTQAPQPQGLPIMATPQAQPTQAPQPQGLPIMATPQAQPTPQAATVDDVLKAIDGLGKTMQNGFLQGSQQPTPPTAETILAEIINPPTKEKK